MATDDPTDPELLAQMRAYWYTQGRLGCYLCCAKLMDPTEPVRGGGPAQLCIRCRPLPNLLETIGQNAVAEAWLKADRHTMTFPASAIGFR